MPTNTTHQTDTKLEIKNLACWRNEDILFSSLNLTLKPEDVVFLEGENGCGKTSFLRILCGFRQQDEGEIFWNNKPVNAASKYFRNILYVGHQNGIKDELTVEENINLMCSFSTCADIKTESILKKTGLLKHSDVLTRQLSSGQKRKLALSRLMMTTKSLWILDEPFTSLDKSSVKLFELLIREHVSHGGMIILTSHHDIDLSGLSVNYLNFANIKT